MINPIHTYPLDTHVRQSQKPENSDSTIFKETLDKATGTDETPGTSSGISSADILSEISAIQAVPTEESPDPIQIKTTALIQKLSDYTTHLGDGKMNLREIEPLLDEIKSDAETLLEETENTVEGNGNSTLIDIARHSAITANAEYIKFQRGDYL